MAGAGFRGVTSLSNCFFGDMSLRVRDGIGEWKPAETYSHAPDRWSRPMDWGGAVMGDSTDAAHPDFQWLDKHRRDGSNPWTASLAKAEPWLLNAGRLGRLDWHETSHYLLAGLGTDPLATRR